MFDGLNKYQQQIHTGNELRIDRTTKQHTKNVEWEKDGKNEKKETKIFQIKWNSWEIIIKGNNKTHKQWANNSKEWVEYCNGKSCEAAYIT